MRLERHFNNGVEANPSTYTYLEIYRLDRKKWHVRCHKVEGFDVYHWELFFSRKKATAYAEKLVEKYGLIEDINSSERV